MNSGMNSGMNPVCKICGAELKKRKQLCGLFYSTFCKKCWINIWSCGLCDDYKSASQSQTHDDRIRHLHDTHKLPKSTIKFSHTRTGFTWLGIPLDISDDKLKYPSLLQFNVPVFIIFLNPEFDINDIAAMWIKAKDDNCPHDYMDGIQNANEITEAYIPTLQYSCCICGMEYEYISKEICEDHIYRCAKYVC